MSKIFKIQEKISNLLYPPVCGICGKIAPKGICIKCNVELKKQAEENILQKEEIEEINETEEIQEEEIPPLDEGDYQDVDYKSMLEDTLKDL